MAGRAEAPVAASRGGRGLGCEGPGIGAQPDGGDGSGIVCRLSLARAALAWAT